MNEPLLVVLLILLLLLLLSNGNSPPYRESEVIIVRPVERTPDSGLGCLGLVFLVVIAAILLANRFP